MGKSETSALDDGSSTDTTKAKNSNEMDDCKFTDTSKTETQTYNNDSATSERKKSSDNFYEDYSRGKLQKEPEGNNDENSEVRSVDSRSKKLLEQLLRSELLEQLLARPQAFAVLLFFAYCLTIKPIKFIWLRNPVRRALLEKINMDIESNQKLKDSLEEKANWISKETEDVKEELREVEAEFNRKDKFIKNNEVNWKEYDKRALKAFGSVTSFLSNYKNKFANSIEKLIEDENLAFKEESGIYEESMPKEKADELFNSRCEKLENRRNVRTDLVEKFSKEVEDMRLGFKALKDSVARFLNLVKLDIKNLKNRKDRLKSKLENVSQKAKRKLTKVQNEISIVSHKIREQENKRREIERRSVCRDFCTYLIHQQA